MRTRIIMLSGLLLLAVAVNGYADISIEKSYTDKISEKLGRGVVNIGCSGIEITREFEKEIDNDQLPAAVTTGVLKGTFQMIKRILVGTFEVATFYVPNEPFMKPVYVMPDKEIAQ